MSLDVVSLYRILEDAYGGLRWWPAESPFEVAVGAILTQRTSWSNVERSLEALRARGLLDANRLASVDIAPLERTIRPSGFYRQKARYLRALSAHVRDACSGDISNMSGRPCEQVRRELLELPGIGKETADSILAYALGMPSFVVDAYTYRLLDRLGIEREGGYECVKLMFEEALGRDPERLARAHALIVEHCKRHCRSTPLCVGCPLVLRCPSESEQ